MAGLETDLSILKKLNLQRPPVGVKYLLNKPDGVKPLGKTLALCEMMVEAQKGQAFYAAKEHHECVGTLPLGMLDIDSILGSGQAGPKLEIFEEARANRRIYDVLPRVQKDTINYAVFAPLDEIDFDPDVLLITGTPSQAEIVLRASYYTTGKLLTSKMTPVIGCAWIYVYPYISGEINYTVTGLCFGMKARQVYPEGLVIVSIPFDLIPSVIHNLGKIKWVLPSYTEGRDSYSRHFKRLEKELGEEFGRETK
jgi:uncharacterized protein (DUF169 family)